MPSTPGVNQGEQATFQEALTAQAVRLAEPATTGRAVMAAADVAPGPVVFERPELHLKRYYFATAVSRRGRLGGWSAARAVPVAVPSGAPSAPAVTYDATSYALRWTAAADAWTAPAAADGVLESRPLGPVRPPTRYNVYAVTGGIPRRINTLCNRLLLAAYLAEQHHIRASDVRAVANEIREELGPDAVRTVDVSDAGATGALSGRLDDVAMQKYFNHLEGRIDRLDRTVAASVDLLHRLLHPERAAKPGPQDGGPT